MIFFILLSMEILKSWKFDIHCLVSGKIPRRGKFIANKLAPLVTGLANLIVPKVFPCPKIVMLCTQNYDENRKAIVNQNTQEEILSITESEFFTLSDLGLGFRIESSNERIDLDKLAQAYDKLERSFQDLYIKGLICSASTSSVTVTLDKDHKPPYQYDIFMPWVQNTISLLSFCLGLDNFQ